MISKRLEKFETAANNTTYNSELQKQRQLKNNVCIMGVPSFEAESPITTAITVFKAVGCELSTSSIVSAYRTKGTSSQIVVKLSNYDDKIKILNAKAKKVVRVSEIAICDPSVATNFVFINNHVTPYFGQLLKEGRAAVKNRQIHSCWLSSSGCMLKLDEEGVSMNISTINELQKIIRDKASTSKSKQQEGKRNKPDDVTNSSNEQKSKQSRSNKEKK